MIKVLKVDSIFVPQLLKELFRLHLEFLPKNVVLDALDLDNGGAREGRIEFAIDGDVLGGAFVDVPNCAQLIFDLSYIRPCRGVHVDFSQLIGSEGEDLDGESLGLLRIETNDFDQLIINQLQLDRLETLRALCFQLRYEIRRHRDGKVDGCNEVPRILRVMIDLLAELEHLGPLTANCDNVLAMIDFAFLQVKIFIILILVVFYLRENVIWVGLLALLINHHERPKSWIHLLQIGCVLQHSS